MTSRPARLYDPTFPIFNKELPREEFDRQLAENPLNDKLLQVAEDAASVADAEEPDAGEPLDAPLPVGRIDFLGTNGSVGESVEYTDAEEFVAAIKEENHVGAPMRIVLYRDGQGQTISQDFLAELDPPPQGFEVIDMAQAQLERAKWLINAYCMEVFEQEADFSDLSHVPPGVQLHQRQRPYRGDQRRPGILPPVLSGGRCGGHFHPMRRLP